MTCWITLPAELQARYHHYAPQIQRIGLDTEFIHQSTYWPKLALVQMAVADEIWLIDPLVPGMDQALQLWLNDTQIVKIMHSASQDIAVFKHACATIPHPLWDTQIGAALSGIGGRCSYQELVAELAGVNLAKTQSRSNWLQRPLSASQWEYAADDVRYLLTVADALSARLQSQGRMTWFEQDNQRLLDSVERDSNQRWPALPPAMVSGLSDGAYLRLRRLLHWREQHAQRSNRPRQWIAGNEFLLTLARYPPKNRRALDYKLAVSPKAPRALLQPLWQALITPLPDEAALENKPPQGEIDKSLLRQMQELVAQRSTELGLPEGLLAARKHLVSLLQTGCWPRALGGWRQTQLQSLLSPLMPKIS